MVASRVWFGDGVLACQVARTGHTTPTLSAPRRTNTASRSGSCSDNKKNNITGAEIKGDGGTEDVPEEGVEEAG